MFSVSVSSAVRGFHVYNDIWMSVVGEELTCERQVDNIHDRFAVSVRTKREDGTGEIVGHVPKFISTICSIFIRRGGEIICRVTGTRRYSSDLPQGGMEIPCILLFRSSTQKECDKAEHFLKSSCSATAAKSVVRGIDAATPAIIAHDPVCPSHPPDSLASNNSHQKLQQPRPQQPVKTSDSKVKTIDPRRIVAKDILEMLSDEDDVEPPNKKFKYSIDLERVVTGEPLSDQEINISQKLLRSQFPVINGLRSTLLQDKKDHSQIGPSDNKIQIIHCRERSHWVTATTIGCEVGEIKVYDSLYTALDKASIVVVSRLFKCKERSCKITVVCPQKQVGASDCGLFAIAFATSVAITRKVMERYDQRRMRMHLVSCIEKQEMSMFPSL